MAKRIRTLSILAGTALLVHAPVCVFAQGTGQHDAGEGVAIPASELTLVEQFRGYMADVLYAQSAGDSAPEAGVPVVERARKGRLTWYGIGYESRNGVEGASVSGTAAAAASAGTASASGADGAAGAGAGGAGAGGDSGAGGEGDAGSGNGNGPGR